MFCSAECSCGPAVVEARHFYNDTQTLVLVFTVSHAGEHPRVGIQDCCRHTEGLGGPCEFASWLIRE